MAFVLAALALVSLTVFFVTGAHRQRTARVAEAGESPLLSVPLMEYGLWALKPFVRVATALRLPPDAFSWASLLFHVGAGIAFVRGQVDWAVLGLLCGGACDSLDGAVARARGVASASGEVLDAVMDRWSELAVFFGIAYWYRDLASGFWLALWAAAGATMVSYTRAKAQAMGVKSSGGLMQRHERAVFLLVGVLLAAILAHLAPAYADWPLLVALMLIATLSTLASIVRTIALRAALRLPVRP